MLGNNFKTAFRSLKKNKGFTILNITGLAIGLAVCLLIVFYVVDELSDDRYHVNGDRIYRINTTVKDNPLNKEIIFGQDQKVYHIIGIAKDFNFSSLRDNVTPIALTMMTVFERKKQGDDPDNLCIKINAGNVAALMASIENKWKTFSNNQEFDYSFMDDDFDALYRAEQRTGKISLLLTTLAMFIACLGLFGLAAYAAEQRTREIGIRKVLGANVPNIVTMLAANFIKLVTIAILVASPLACSMVDLYRSRAGRHPDCICYRQHTIPQGSHCQSRTKPKRKIGSQHYPCGFFTSFA